MFKLFQKNPTAKLEKQYQRMLEEARDLQRGGDIKGFSKKMGEAEALAKEIEAAKK